MNGVEITPTTDPEELDFEDVTIIEYKTRISEYWGHTWEFLHKNRLVAGIIAVVAAVSCICTVTTLGLIYGASLGVGVGLSEAAFSQTYFGETDLASSAFGQYVITPLMGLVTICGASVLYVSMWVVAFGASMHNH